MSLSTLQRWVALSSLACLSIGPAVPASAALVTFTFQGATVCDSGRSEFPLSSDPCALGFDAFRLFGPEQIPEGQPFTFSYSFESTTPDSDPHPESGRYLGAVSSFTFNMAGQTLTLIPNIPNKITVTNAGPFGDDLEQYGLIIGEALVEEGIFRGLGVFFTARTGRVNAFESDALPISLSDLNFFLARDFTMIGQVGPLEEEPFTFLRLPGFAFVLLVPEPGTMALIILALGCLACVHLRPGRQVRG